MVLPVQNRERLIRLVCNSHENYNWIREYPGDFFGSTITANVIFRYPLDMKYPTLHLAPYVFGGVGGLINSNNTLPGSLPSDRRTV
jgi:hypothetical protein